MKRPKAFEVSPARVRIKRGPRDDGRWYWRADRPDGHGGRVDVWVGWATKDEAAEEVRRALDADPGQPAGPAIAVVGELLDRWRAAIWLERPDPKDRTRLAIEGAIERLLVHGLPVVSVEVLQRSHLVAHVQGATAAGFAGSTIVRDLKYLRQAWKWGQELIPPQIPLRRLPSVKVEAKPVYTRFTPAADEVGGLLDDVSPMVRRAIILLAATGARAGEALTLTWDRVTLDCAQVLVDGKTGPRWVEVPDVIAAEIRTWGRGEPGDRVAQISGNRVRVALARRSAALGLGRVSPNGLRRHVVDALYEAASADPKAAGSQVGHSAETALRNYRQVRPKQRRKVVEGAKLGVVLAFTPPERDEEAG